MNVQWKGFRVLGRKSYKINKETDFTKKVSGIYLGFHEAHNALQNLTCKINPIGLDVSIVACIKT
jgi:hypothetical protein